MPYFLTDPDFADLLTRLEIAVLTTTLRPEGDLRAQLIEGLAASNVMPESTRADLERHAA